MGTVESVVVFYNHHTHRLVEAWQDEMYHEKNPAGTLVEVAPGVDIAALNIASLNRALHNDPKVKP